jgi:hypothetical protein
MFGSRSISLIYGHRATSDHNINGHQSRIFGNMGTASFVLIYEIWILYGIHAGALCLHLELDMYSS